MRAIIVKPLDRYHDLRLRHTALLAMLAETEDELRRLQRRLLETGDIQDDDAEAA